MSKPTHEPAILQEPRRHRYLRLIALFKIGKGVLLLLLGVSLLFLNARSRWMDALSNWTADEILLEHSKAVNYLLNKLQAVLAGGTLRATGEHGLQFVQQIIHCLAVFQQDLISGPVREGIHPATPRVQEKQ